MEHLLAGYWVLITAVRPQEREELARLVARCGGESQSAFSLRDPPHLVLTRSVRSPKYRALVRAHPQVPVVTPEWLTAAAQAGRLAPYDQYRVGPFLGLTLCFSGLSASKKVELAALVARGGGAHSPALDKKCTHLVTNSTDSEKYRFAKREGIIVVTTAWVEDSISGGTCQDEAAYALADGPAEGGGQTAAGGPAAPPRLALGGPDEATTLSVLGPGGTAAAPTAAAAPIAADAAPARGPSHLQRGAAAAGGAAAIAAGQATAQAALEAQLEWDDGTPPYMDAVRLRLLGCGAAESQEALALVRQGAAKRFAEWREDLNHLAVGSDLTAAEAADALEFLSTHRACVPVTLEWLRQSVAAGQRLRPDGHLVPTSRFSQYRRNPPALERAAGAGRPAERTLSAGSGEADVAWADLGRTQTMAVPAGPLDGCYFTLAAVRGTEAEARARQLVQEQGGRVFTETTLQRISDKSKAFAICPPSLQPIDITQLRSACLDFRLVEERQRFTVYWLECSVEAGYPLSPSRGAPLYQPLPYPLPMPGMSDVVVCPTGYDVPVRVAIKRTVEVLGGHVTETMTRRNTHLMLPVAAGNKFEYADEFGVIAVTADWLVDTVQLGRRQPEAHYVPRPPAGQPSVVRVAAGAGVEHSRGSSDPAGVTQMPGAAQTRPQQKQQEQQQQGGSHRPPQPPKQPPAEQRPQLVLPPPPGQQQQQQERAAAPLAGGVGGRRMSLRERMRANQAATGGGAAPAELEPVNDENAVGQGSNSSAGADQLWGKQQSLQQAAAPAPQPSALDEAMGALDHGAARQQAAAAAAAAAPQALLFTELFGASPDAQPMSPAAAPAPPAAPPPRGQDPHPSAKQQQTAGGRGSGRAPRGSSRLRPADQQQQQQTAATTVAVAAAGAPAAAAAGTAEAAAAVAAGAASEPQEDVAQAIDNLNHLLGGLAAEAPVLRCGSQLDALMPPPPARARGGAKRGGPTPAESSLSNGSGGRGSKRPLTADDGAASGNSGGRGGAPRRSGRGRGGDALEAPGPHLDMSQQVGYADSLDEPLARMPTRSASLSDKQLLKQRLAATAGAGQGRRGAATAAAAAARAADPLADLL